jgi:flagellar basal body-associated protein FliL
VGPPGARPFAFSPQGLADAENGNAQTVYGEGGPRMATWLWVLIIVLLVVLLFGGVGYGRWGTRV